MSQDLQTISLWSDYRSRRRWVFVICLTYIPAVFALGYPLMRLFGSEIPIYVVAGVWMLAFIVFANYMEAFRCPRCRRAFFRSWWFHNPLARRCVHCGLPKWSDSDLEYDDRPV